jgi:hypothetical protein
VLATKADIYSLKSEISSVKSEISSVKSEISLLNLKSTLVKRFTGCQRQHLQGNIFMGIAVYRDDRKFSGNLKINKIRDAA